MTTIEILDAIEDLIDGQDAPEAITEAEQSGEPNVPWEAPRAKLGL